MDNYRLAKYYVKASIKHHKVHILWVVVARVGLNHCYFNNFV